MTQLSVRATVVAGFAILAVASLGLLAINTHTPLAVTATILAGRAAAIGLVITPLLYAITSTLDTAQLAGATSLFNIFQHLAGSLGIGLIAALFTTQSHTHGPVGALPTTGLLLTTIATTVAAATRLPNRRLDTDPDLDLATQSSTAEPAMDSPVAGSTRPGTVPLTTKARLRRPEMSAGRDSGPALPRVGSSIDRLARWARHRSRSPA